MIELKDQRSLKLGEHDLKARPALDVASRVRTLSDLGLDKLKLSFGKIGQVVELRKCQIKEKLATDVERAARALPALYVNLAQGFGLEEQGLKAEISRIQDEIMSLARVAYRETLGLDRKSSSLSVAAQKVEARSRGKHDYLTNVVGQFPEARVVDLSCLYQIKLSNGLPALTLFSLTSDKVIYEMYRRGNAKLNIKFTDSYNPKNCSFPQSTADAITRQVNEATGVCSIDGANTSKPTASITLSTKFGSRFVPENVRSKIRLAADLALFDEIFLLAEVPAWQVTYSNFEGDRKKVKIHGDIEERKLNPDPIVLGLKQLNSGEFIAVSIASFNTSSAEELVRNEWSVKP